MNGESLRERVTHHFLQKGEVFDPFSAASKLLVSAAFNITFGGRNFAPFSASSPAIAQNSQPSGAAHKLQTDWRGILLAINKHQGSLLIQGIVCPKFIQF